MEHAKGMRNT